MRKKLSLLLAFVLSFAIVIPVLATEQTRVAQDNHELCYNAYCNHEHSFYDMKHEFKSEYAYLQEFILGLFTEDDKDFIRYRVYYGLYEEALLFINEVLANNSVLTFNENIYH